MDQAQLSSLQLRVSGQIKIVAYRSLVPETVDNRLALHLLHFKFPKFNILIRTPTGHTSTVWSDVDGPDCAFVRLV